MAWAVFGIIYGPDGNPAGGVRILFRPAESRARPFTTGVATQGGVVGTTSNGTGYFRVTLLPGKHYLWIGSSRRRSIVVPETPGENLLQDLLGVIGTPPELPTNFRVSNGVRQLLNATTGGWHTIAVVGAPTERRFGFAAAGVGTTGENFRYRDGMLEIADYGNFTWHAPALQSSRLSVAADGATPQVVDRIQSGTWQIRDLVTNAYRTWFITGAAGTERLSFGPEVS